MGKEILLSVKNLTVTLDSTPLVENVDFAVKRGEALAIVGPNGAGKTTIFRAILGFIPYKGDVTWKDDVRIGYVPQRISIEQKTPLSVKEFFSLKRDRGGESSKCLEMVGLGAEMLKKNMGVLSSGELQRILIAWALVGEPDILLFDEPTEGIDVGAEENIYTILHNLRVLKNMSVILISHDLNIVYKHADTVLCLNKQKICYGHPTETLTEENLRALYGKEVTVYTHSHQ